jgi:PIN like domain
VSLSSLPPSGGHPAGLPELFVDRSFGRVQVPRRLRAAGLRLVTLAEHYGRPADESISDVEWLAEAGLRDWVVLKDERIRRRAAEKEVLMGARVRCFVITRGDVRAEQMGPAFPC